MFSIDRIAKSIQTLYHRVRGDYAIHDSLGGYSAIDNMTIRSAVGYTLVVYCQKKQVYHKFDKWFIPNRIMNQYRIFSVTSTDAPLYLQDACQLEMETDSLFPDTPNDSVQKETAIREYLELLLHRLHTSSSTT